MLSMQTPAQKERIVPEAARLLHPGGRCAIHKLCIIPDDLDDQTRKEPGGELSMQTHTGVQPLSAGEWRTLLQRGGLEVEAEFRAPLRLLEPTRIIADEGIAGSLRIGLNLLLNRQPRQRVLCMRRTFRKYQNHLGAIAFRARRKES